MAGEAKTSEFLLSTATVMIGPQADVMELYPDKHGVGLVKNVMSQADMTFTELTQGLTNSIVMSVNTKADTKVSFEVYEYTAANLAYAAGLDGSQETDQTTNNPLLLASDYTGNGTVALAVGDGAKCQAGGYVILQDTTETDRVAVMKIGSIATDTLTIVPAYVSDAMVTFSHLTTQVYVVNAIGMGANGVGQPTFGAKIVGLLPGTGEPVTLIFPKVKVTKGASVSFMNNNFVNMPFEITPYQLLPADPFYGDFGLKTWKIFKA